MMKSRSLQTTIGRLAAIALTTASVAISWPSHVIGQPASHIELVYAEQLEGVYGQNWFAQVLGDRTGSGVEVYVVGDGKTGDFFGIISVDCQTPRYSRWLATGGYVPDHQIPSEAILRIRNLACR